MHCTVGAAASTSTVTDVGGDFSPDWSVALSVTVVTPLAVSGSSRGSLRPVPLRVPLVDCAPDSA